MSRRDPQPTTTSKRTLGTFALVIFLVSASAPMTVTGGGIPAAIGATGSIAIALVFPLVAVILGLFVVGYAAFSRYVTAAGAFYAYITDGLGRTAGVVGAFLAMAAYSTVQWALYGLFGAVASGFAATTWGLTWTWPVWAFIAWAVIAVCGLRKIDLSKWITIVVVVCETLAVLVIVAAAFAAPADGRVQLDALDPTKLTDAGLVVFGGAAVMVMACLIGFEGAAAFSADVKNDNTLARATWIALGTLSASYCLIAVALTVAGGPANVVNLVRDPNSGFPYVVVETQFGAGVSTAVNVALILSVFAAALTFHNIGARYALPLGVNRVLPRFFALKSDKTEAPIGGSLAQSGAAALVIGVAYDNEVDPVFGLFTWASYVTGLALLALLIAVSAATIAYFRKNPDLPETRWRTFTAPALSVLTLSALVVATVAAAGMILGDAAPGYMRWLLPATVAIVAVAGLLWALRVRNRMTDLTRLRGDVRAVDADTRVINPESVKL